MSNRVEELEVQMTTFKEEFGKFMEHDNKSAATRARKALMEMIRISKETRKEISDRKNTL